MIIAWNEYTCKVSGGTYKFVECEDCKQKYVYQMNREAKGQGTSLYFLDNAGAQNRASKQAQAALKKALETDCDPVPCPKCGAFQQNMMEKICREYRMWMFWLGVFTIFGSVLLGALGYTFFATEPRMLGLVMLFGAFLGVVGGAAVIAWRKQMGRDFEPNDTPLEQRLALAEARAVKVKNFEKWLTEQGVEVNQPVPG